MAYAAASLAVLTDKLLAAEDEKDATVLMVAQRGEMLHRLIQEEEETVCLGGYICYQCNHSTELPNLSAVWWAASHAGNSAGPECV